MKEVRRNSSIELLRIVAMMLVIAHHYVVNSGVDACYNYADPTLKMIFLQLWGMWGKMAINAFVLITGYFMCTSSLTMCRFMKLYLEMMFYALGIWAVLLLCGYETLSAARIARIFTWPYTGNNLGFGPSFLWFYLGIPFYNILIKGMTRRQIYSLVGVLLLMFCVASNVFYNKAVFHHVFWYMTLYFMGAIFRLHPQNWMNTNRRCVPFLAGSVILGWVSVIGMTYARSLGLHAHGPYLMVSESDRFVSVVVGALLFLVFKNLSLPYNRFVNSIASTTFGVLLIHTAGDGMRRFLWDDFLAVRMHAESLPLFELIGYSLACMFGVFAACGAIDWLRIVLVERPVLRWIGGCVKR